MELREAIRKRRSVRRYVKGAPVSEEDLKGMLEAAMMAPSANNRRPWEFIVVESEEKKAPHWRPGNKNMQFRDNNYSLR